MDRPFYAIAAMAENRVIGAAGKIPWHLPGDFKFFKKTTMGHLLVMGRQTYDSIGRPLPGRTTVVLSRQRGLTIPGAIVINDWDALRSIEPEKKVFLAGGAQLYAQLLPRCADLFLTRVRGTPAGDAFFPPFEDLFDAGELLESAPEFSIYRYRRKKS